MSSSDPTQASAAAAPKPLVKKVVLEWSREDLRFEGGPEGVPPSVVDGGSRDGPSPMDHLLLALAGCMGADVIDILQKGRVPVRRFRVDVVAHRAPDPPRRYTSIQLSFHVSGPASADRPKVERAVKLSRETYCSVTHTLRPDLDMTYEIRLD